LDINLAHTQPLATDFAFAYLWGEKTRLLGLRLTPRPESSTRINNFAPRVGIAYALNTRTVIRTGFGIFYDYNTNLIQNSIRGFHYPFAVTRTVGGQNLPIPGPYNLSTNPYAPFSPAIANLSGTVDLNRRDPYAIEYNFGIQQMLTGNLLLEVDYVGTNGQSD
jgi:hypothetical protein